MAAKLKSGKVRGAAHKLAAKSPNRRGQTAAQEPGDWVRITQVGDECEDLIDYERIVHGDDGRRLPLYYDDYN